MRSNASFGKTKPLQWRIVYLHPRKDGQDHRIIERMTIDDLSLFFRIGPPTRIVPLLAACAFAAPAAAEEAPLPYEITATGPDTGLAPEIEEEPARYLQNTDIDENILLPGARPDDDDDDSDRKWSRNYIAVAAGVLNSADYNARTTAAFCRPFTSAAGTKAFPSRPAAPISRST